MRNLTMLTDLYELTMMYGYWKKGMGKNRAVFDMFYRATSEITAYAIAAGLEQVIEYVNNLHFAEEDIAYLRSLRLTAARCLSLDSGVRRGRTRAYTVRARR